MGQGELYEYLKEKKDWTCVTDLLTAVGGCRTSVDRSLRQMVKYGVVDRKECRESRQLRIYFKVKK